MPLILAVTANRPKNLFPGMSFDQIFHEMHPKLGDFAAFILHKHDVGMVYTTLDLGFPMAVAAACEALEIPYRAAIPYLEQSRYWPQMVVNEYDRMLQNADRKYLISRGEYTEEKVEIANSFILNRCDRLLALYSGAPGRTEKFVNLAEKAKKPVDYLWPTWQQYRVDGALMEAGLL